MGKDPAAAPEGAPACGTLVALGACAFVAGLALGLTQPLAFVAIGPGLVAGATYVGLLFLVCLVVALVMTLLAFFGARWFTVPAFVACGSLALGLLAGNWTAVTFDIGFGTDRPAAAGPSFAPPAPAPVILEAPGTVILRLDGVPDFTPNGGTERETFVDERATSLRKASGASGATRDPTRRRSPRSRRSTRARSETRPSGSSCVSWRRAGCPCRRRFRASMSGS